jgi:hypothetical protein
LAEPPNNILEALLALDWDVQFSNQLAYRATMNLGKDMERWFTLLDDVAPHWIFLRPESDSTISLPLPIHSPYLFDAEVTPVVL